MASSVRDTNMSEETFEYICTSCVDENDIKEGTKYCVECKGYCCKDCVSNHKKYFALKEHSLLDISNSQHVDQASKLPSFPTEKCRIHQGKVIDMFCGDHGVVGCYACIAIDHKYCKDIQSIPDDVDQLTNCGEFDRVDKVLQAMTESLNSTQQHTNGVYLQNIERAKQNALQAITEHRMLTIAILDRLTEEAHSEVESLYEQMKTSIVDINRRIQLSLNTITEIREKLKKAEGNKAQKFVCLKLVSSKIIKEQNDIMKCDQELETFKGDNVFSFVSDKSVLEFLGRIDKIGQLKVGSRYSSGPFIAKQCQDIVVRLPNDANTCRIGGGCPLGDDEVIITDYANNKLKRVDISQMSVVDHICLPYIPIGVCRVKDDQVAVACYFDKLVQIVTLDPTMTVSRQIKLTHRCYSVDCLDDKLYICDNSSSLYIYDMFGTLLQRVCKDNTGGILFKCCAQLALSDKEEYMFVADYDGFVCLDKKGNHIATMKYPDINGVKGVCIDGRGNVFIAGEKSNNVVQLRYDGTKVGVIVKTEDGIHEPKSLFFHRNLRKLFVSMFENDKMKMFDLE